MTNLQCDIYNHLVACEDFEQRVVPTGIAARDNERRTHPDFSKTYFRRVATGVSP